jgi:iron complex outermembrane recepter protein
VNRVKKVPSATTGGAFFQWGITEMTVGTLRLRLGSACSLIALAVTYPAAALAAEAAAEQTGGTVSDEDILVIGTRYISGIQPERELDQLGIESYGQSTIDELVAEIQGELGDDEQPLILVNGERVSGVDEIGGLPVEALENVKVLPRGSAVRAGGTARQRVVNLTLKKQTRSATALLAPKISTDGDWSAIRGEGILTYIRGSTRGNLTFKARGETDLLESDRDITQPEQRFAQTGNVVGFPLNLSGEIDPLLSAAAGEIVAIAPVPATSNPTLLDFVPDANEAAFTDLGDFRTLRPRTRNYDLNGTFSTRITSWLTANVGIRLGHSTRRSLRGLPQAFFVLSPTNATSPFSTTVAIAQFGDQALATRSERDSGEINLTLNGHIGAWTSYFNARHFESKDDTRTERQALSGNITVPDSVDAFGSDLFHLVPMRTDRAEAKNRITQAKQAFTGPLVALPAGTAQATIEGQFIGNRLHSESDFTLVNPSRTFHRDETSLRGAIELPLTVHDGFGGAIGDLSATAEYTRVHYSDAGNVSNHQFGVAWEPRPVLRLSADLEKTSLPVAVQLLGNPTIVTSGVLTFDPLTGESVNVTQITGGNPDLEPQETTVHRLAALVRLVERLNLQLNAEYTDTKERNFVSSLPEASAAVNLAFPERFLRDLSGTLTTVDLRPVNFDSHREKRFRYGISLNSRLGQSGTSRGDVRVPRAQRDPRGPATRVSFTASHSILFKDEIVIRPSLPDVDLLEGGALGLGGGRVRHQLDATASITSGGSGLRVSANWRGKSTLKALDEGFEDTLRFSPVFLLNLRAFADMHRFLPRTEWSRGMRLSLNVLNMTNDRQEVLDSDGETPLRYQPGYRDPLGRTMELELRKVF